MVQQKDQPLRPPQGERPDSSPEWAEAPGPEAPDRPSKSQRKRDALALQELGTRLIALPATRLAQLQLPDTLREALVTARRMRSHGARTRHMQYIGRLMRELDTETLDTVRQEITPGRSATPRPRR